MIVVTESALIAATQWAERAGVKLSVPLMHGLIEATLPHLAVEPDPAEPVTERGLDGQWLATQLEQLGELQDIVVDHRAECERLAAAPAPQAADGGREAAAYQRGYNAALWRADDAYRKGVSIGRAEGEGTVLDGQLVESGPSDYQVWLDAMQLAVARLGNTGDRAELYDLAGWFRGQLRVQLIEVDDDEDDGTRADEDPTDDEVDCVRCGAPPGGHPDGCPTMVGPFGTYPGHDATVTVGACRPDSPCPACVQRVERAAAVDPDEQYSSAKAQSRIDD